MKIAILGCGVMGSAFARQLAKQGHQLALCDRRREVGMVLADELGASFFDDPNEAADKAEVVLLAIKPDQIEDISQQLEGRKRTLLSILAGTSIAEMQEWFPGCQIIRAMPNLALIHGESIIALVGDEDVDEELKRKVSELLDPMGMVFWTEEEKMDAITALAGSGPAFIIAIVEALVEAGIQMGLPVQIARSVALKMIQGAVSLMEHHEGHPGEIRWRISSPKGTTIAGLNALEKEGVRSGIIQTVLASYEKAKDMR